MKEPTAEQIISMFERIGARQLHALEYLPVLDGPQHGKLVKRRVGQRSFRVLIANDDGNHTLTTVTYNLVPHPHAPTTLHAWSCGMGWSGDAGEGEE